MIDRATLLGLIPHQLGMCLLDAVTAWDDGNPYYFDEEGKKAYAYHPDSMRERCIGNDVPHPCLGCGDEFRVDSNAPTCTLSGCCSHSLIRMSPSFDGYH